MKELEDFKKHFDPLFLEHVRKCVDGVLAHHPEFAPVSGHFLKLAEGGKRLRPFVLGLAYKTGLSYIAGLTHKTGLDPDGINLGEPDAASILPAQFALELFQLFALIHDDIMDGATMRHGIETIHTRFDSNQAILLGDHCLIWAMKAIALCEKTAKKELEIFMSFAEETTTGQTMDIWLSKKRGASEDQLDASIELKTAKYTFVYPMLLGLSYAGEGYSLEYIGEEGSDLSALQFTEQFKSLGLLLGKAFQRLDDLSDILADQTEFGKKPGADVTADVPTHLSIYFDKHATDGQKAIYEVYRGQPLDRNDMSRIRELFVISGAISREKAAVTALLGISRELIESMSMAEENKKTWRSLADLFTKKLKALT